MIAWAQVEPDYERPPVSYSASTPRDAFARLQTRLATGETILAGDEQRMVRTLLNELGVPVDSQMLVFSRTSFQRDRISPERPRALYFSDSIYVGWVPGGLVEIAAIDPHLGPIFYSLEFPGPRGGAPNVVREGDCLRCHGGTFVRDIPGLFVRSLFPDAKGDPLLRQGTQLVDDATPFEQRWGGWYVTGYHGVPAHRGNVLASERADQLVFEPAKQRPDELSAFFETRTYLNPTSDVVALLVLEHQMSMQNSLTRAALASRRMLAYQHGLQQAFKEPLSDDPAYDSVKSVYDGAAQDVVDHLLFYQAALLPPGISGNEAFRNSFAHGAPRSRAGYALKELKLQGRLFAQRCGYLIYSETFRALPDPLKSRILDRLKSALESRDSNDRYAYLPADEKQRIYDILIETHPDAKAQWKR